MWEEGFWQGANEKEPVWEEDGLFGPVTAAFELLEQPDNKECSSTEVINALTSFSMSLWDSMFLILELLRT